MHYKIVYGGWYQRTTLHLSEVYDLFARGYSNLPLSKEKLHSFSKALNLKEVTREPGYLEFVRAYTRDGIEIRYYEDGLYVLEALSDDVEKGKKILEDYFLKTLNPAIEYIFSLGAPTPKVLANIKTEHPVAVSVVSKSRTLTIDPKKFGVVYSEIKSDIATVYKTPSYIFLVTPTSKSSVATDLIEMQIFFREFKDQLEKYLHIHRTIWEEIASIKERHVVRGKEIGALRSKLDAYQTTVNLITNRINQMGSYVHTRASIAQNLEIKKELVLLFEYKFEALVNTLEYIKEIWKMTSEYLAAAVQNIVEMKEQNTRAGIQSLQIITSIGVVSGILGYLARNEFPHLTVIGASYFLIILVATWFLNYVMITIYNNRKYKVKFAERAANI